MNEYKYHDGGECPVPAGTKVDVIHRDGQRYGCQSALIRYDGKNTSDGAACEWNHDYMDSDIIAWRLSEVWVILYTGTKENIGLTLCMQ